MLRLCLAGLCAASLMSTSLQTEYPHVSAGVSLEFEKAAAETEESIELIEETDVSVIETVEPVKEKEKQAKETPTKKTEKKKAQKEVKKTKKASYLVKCSNPDAKYKGTKVSIKGKDRKMLEGLVMSEAGADGYAGAALVAQAIRDAMVLEGKYDITWIKKHYGYSGSVNKKPNKDVQKAVKYIFDEGGVAVSHRVLYFYDPNMSKGKWHETQRYVVTYKSHKFFDKQ